MANRTHASVSRAKAEAPRRAEGLRRGVGITAHGAPSGRAEHEAAAGRRGVT